MTDSTSSKSSRQSRVESVSDQGSASKRPRNGTRTSKKEVKEEVEAGYNLEADINSEADIDSEADVNSETDIDLEADVDSEADFKTTYIDNRLSDEDIIPNLDNLDEVMECVEEGSAGKRQTNKKPAQYMA
jgi:hypothetical protein